MKVGDLMQDGWSRSSAHLTLDAAEIARLLKPALGAQAITAFEPLSGGLANTSYRVTLAGRDEPVVVRLFTRDPSACATEVALAALLADTVPSVPSVPMPRPLYAACDAEPPYAVSSWVEGVKLEALLRDGSAADAHSAGRAAGATLAAVHAHPFAEAGFFGPGPGADLTIATPLGPIRAACEGYVEAGLGNPLVRSRLGEALAARLAARLREGAPLLDTLPAGATLVHGDYKPQNLLLRRTEAAASGWGMAAVLDWEFAFAGPPLFDVGQLLRYRATLPPEYTAGVVEGYTAAGGTLPAEWRRLTRLLDLMNLLGFLERPEATAPMVRELRTLAALED